MTPTQHETDFPGWRSRRAAADLLFRLADSHGLEQAMEASAHYAALSGSDRRWARAMAGAALRVRGRLDLALAAAMDRPLNRLDAPVLALLRIGAAQSAVMGTPAHAAVSATVEAARQWRSESRRSCGFVNAVLRRIAANPDFYARQDVMSVWPAWLAETFRTEMGDERAAAMARLHLVPPTLDLTVKADPPLWAERLKGAPTAFGVRLDSGGDIADLEGYAQGHWWVQNCASALAVCLLGDVTGVRVGDLCAAPGGKSLQLAAKGADVTSVDSAKARLDRLYENLARTGLRARVVMADIRQWRPETPFDALILDAPCSALGTLRRHPEAVWRRRPRFADHVRLGGEMIAAASAMLRPGGIMIYCVCTPVRAEGEAQIAAALASGSWQRRPVRSGEIAGFAYAGTVDGDVLTAPPSSYPDLGPEAIVGDVFFMARLQKRG